MLDLAIDPVLQAPSPYTEFRPQAALPPADQLVSASYVVARLGAERLAPTEALAIATREYEFYLWQALHFETMGFRLLGAIAARTADEALFLDLTRQAVDESRHIAVFRTIIAASRPAAAASTSEFKAFHERLVTQLGVDEQIALGFILLEGLAIGLFSARARCYRGSAIAQWDRQILAEESAHQGAGIAAVERLLATGAMTRARLGQALRTAFAEFPTDFVPRELASAYGIAADRRAEGGGGCLVDVQRAIALGAIRRALRRLGMAGAGPEAAA